MWREWLHDRVKEANKKCDQRQRWGQRRCFFALQGFVFLVPWHCESIAYLTLIPWSQIKIAPYPSKGGWGKNKMSARRLVRSLLWSVMWSKSVISTMYMIIKFKCHLGWFVLLWVMKTNQTKTKKAFNFEFGWWYQDRYGGTGLRICEHSFECSCASLPPFILDSVSSVLVLPLIKTLVHFS